MFIYVVMAFWAALGLALNTRLSGMMASALAPTGRALHLHRAVDRVAVGQADLGHLLGVGRAPHLGADPALSLPRLHGAAGGDRRSAPRRPRRRAARDRRRGEHPDHLLLGGWWNTLHQGASVSVTRAPTMAATMLTGMMLMALAFWVYSIAVVAGARALHHPGAWAHERVLRHGRLCVVRVGLVRGDASRAWRSKSSS